MASLGAIWVALRDRENDLERAKKYFGNQSQLVTDDDKFVCVDNNANETAPNEKLQQLSKEFGEAFFMYFQSTIDYFSFARWIEGEVVRELFYYADEGWQVVTGTPEPWEETYLFNENDLESLLEYEDETDADELRRYWATKELEEGKFYPLLSARETCYDLMRFYKLSAVS